MSLLVRFEDSPGSVVLTAVKGVEEVRPLSAIQKAMFKSMTKSLSIPHFGYSDEINMTAANQFRKSLNAQLERTPRHNMTKMSYMPLFVKALSVALTEFPQLNAMLVNAEDVNKVQLKYRPYHNIGLAMDTPGGLIVPNIKNVEQKSIFDIAQDLRRLMEAGKRNALGPDDLKNGTITLSNIGMIGGTYLSPVLLSSELCIGAMGKIQRLPRFKSQWNEASGRQEELVVAQEIMQVSWSADHRVVDGATMARFVTRWKELIEHPALLAAELK
jgi:2-oxoisovalerate dehydrogenase E2 component (dihydrolipoyl transacylase)